MSAQSNDHLHRVLAGLKAGAKDERGVSAVVFALGLAVLAPLTLGIFDVYMASEQRGKLQDALDAAALYAARSSATTTEEIDAVGDKALAANLQLIDGAVLESADFTLDGTKVTAAAQVRMPAFAPSLWQHEPLSVETEVIRSSHNLEVSLVLDTTASMSGQRMTDLRAAAKDLIDIVVQDVQTPFYSKVAVVPYSMGVNVGSYASQVRGTYTPSTTCTTPGCSRYRFINMNDDSVTHTISTCVTERTGANAYTDAAPSTAFLGRNYPSSGNPCLGATIEPLSSSKTTLKNKIDTLTASGSTAGHVGLGWGWYLVSPNFGYLFPAASRPAAYGAEDLIKVVVLMTDGEYNSVYCNGVIAQNSTSGSGSSSDKINCNAPNGGSYAQANALCTAMKARGVIVYTVGFDVVNSQNARDLVNNCATDAEHVYLPSTGTALKDAFHAIALDINSLRISK